MKEEINKKCPICFGSGKSNLGMGASKGKIHTSCNGQGCKGCNQLGYTYFVPMVKCPGCNGTGKKDEFIKNAKKKILEDKSTMKVIDCSCLITDKNKNIVKGISSKYYITSQNRIWNDKSELLGTLEFKYESSKKKGIPDNFYSGLGKGFGDLIGDTYDNMPIGSVTLFPISKGVKLYLNKPDNSQCYILALAYLADGFISVSNKEIKDSAHTKTEKTGWTETYNTRRELIKPNNSSLSSKTKEQQNSYLKYYSSGNSKYELQDYYGAVEDYNKAIELDPNFIKAYINRGNSKVKLKDYVSAIEDYSSALKLNQNYTIAYDNRGFSKYKLNDKNGACLDWNKAKGLGSLSFALLSEEVCNTIIKDTTSLTQPTKNKNLCNDFPFKPGCSNEKIKDIQICLNKLGSVIKVDGYYGPDTLKDLSDQNIFADDDIDDTTITKQIYDRVMQRCAEDVKNDW